MRRITNFTCAIVLSLACSGPRGPVAAPVPSDSFQVSDAVDVGLSEAGSDSAGDLPPGGDVPTDMSSDVDADASPDDGAADLPPPTEASDADVGDGDDGLAEVADGTDGGQWNDIGGDVGTDGTVDADAATDAGEPDMAPPFQWPDPPLANPIEVTVVTDCTQAKPVNDASFLAECATATLADELAWAKCSGKPGYLYVIGGTAYQDWLDDGTLSATPFRLDLATGVWQELPPLPYIKFWPRIERLAGKIITVAGDWYVATESWPWPKKFAAPSPPCDASSCPHTVFAYDYVKWTEVPAAITPGGFTEGAVVRAGCSMFVTQVTSYDVHDGETLALLAELPLPATNSGWAPAQALVPWGSQFVLAVATHEWAKVQSLPLLVLDGQGKLTGKQLPAIPCKFKYPLMWTVGKELFVSDAYKVQKEDWEKKGCPGVEFVPVKGDIVHILHWTGTVWEKAPDMWSRDGPSWIAETPVGPIAVAVSQYMGKKLPATEKTHSGVLVQDKKTFVWKDDVYPPMPHGKVGASAVWSPK